MNNVPYAIEMVNITKKFPGIIANDNVTLQLKRGEIHALLGENGAGKSTLMSVLFGLYQAEEGVIKKNGEVVKINDPNDATALNIGMVHQHFKLVDLFTAAENIVLYYIPVANSDMAQAFDLQADETGLIGIHTGATYNNLSAETVAASGVGLFAEMLDGIVVGTITGA